MPDVMPQGETLMHPILQSAHGYWDEIRGSRPMPARRDFDPVRIPHVLPHIVLNDVVAGPPLRYRYRLVGTQMVGYYGFDPTGRYFDEVGTGAFFDEVVETFGRVRASRRPEFDYLENIWPRLTDYERLILPLADDGATVNILWVTVVGPRDLRRRAPLGEVLLDA